MLVDDDIPVFTSATVLAFVVNVEKGLLAGVTYLSGFKACHIANIRSTLLH